MSGIFISYRRSDNPDATDRIYDRLATEFGRAQVFKDINSIPLGQDFRSHLNDVIQHCAVMLAIVGPRWVDAHNEAGARRLDDAEDFVRLELEAALARNIPVVPVLVGHALMPGVAQLPASLAPLAYRQSIEVRPDPDFQHDAARLVGSLRAMLDPTGAATPVESAAAEQQRDAAMAARTAQRKVRTWQVIAMIAAGGVAALAMPAFRQLRETPPPETRVDIVTPATDQPVSFAVSPDGRQIVYVASGSGASRLWLRSLASATAQPLAGTEGATLPFWSPDSRSIGFFAVGSLKRLDLGGGSPQTLAAASNGRGGAWSVDGVILFTPEIVSPLMRVSASGGTVAAVTALGPHHLAHIQPQFLPDGSRFLFFLRSESPELAGIYLGSLDGGAPMRLTPANSSGVYVAGRLLWARGGTLVAQRLDLAKAALTGEPVTLADGVAADGLYRSAISVANGLVAYRVVGGGGRQLTWFDRSGTVRGTVGEPDGSYNYPRVSPDGRRVAVSRTVQGNQDIWVLDGAHASRFTFDVEPDSFPLWTPDGTHILFRSLRSGGGDLYEKAVNGTGAEELLLGSDQLKAPWSWSADGRYLVYAVTDPKSSGDIWLLPSTGDPAPSVFLQTPFREAGPVISPDGRWVAYMSNESGRQEIYLRPFVSPGTAGNAAAGARQWQVSTSGGIFPAWRPDGKELYYLNTEGTMMAAPVRVTDATVDAGVPIRLFATRIAYGGTDVGQGRQYDVAPDGRFLINSEADNSATPITLIQNWNPEAAH